MPCKFVLSRGSRAGELCGARCGRKQYCTKHEPTPIYEEPENDENPPPSIQTERIVSGRIERSIYSPKISELHNKLDNMVYNFDILVRDLEAIDIMLKRQIYAERGLIQSTKKLLSKERVDYERLNTLFISIFGNNDSSMQHPHTTGLQTSTLTDWFSYLESNNLKDVVIHSIKLLLNFFVPLFLYFLSLLFILYSISVLYGLLMPEFVQESIRWVFALLKKRN